MLGNFALADFSLSDMPPLYQSIGTATGSGSLAGASGVGVGSAIGLATVVGKGSTTSVPFNWLQTVVSQYSNSPILLQMLSYFADCVDQTANLDNFYNFIWNVDTAQGYGLDVWGRIVGVNRVLSIEVGSYFGFQGPGGASGDPFNVSPFYAGGQLTTNFALTDDAFRTLIYAKALSNISDGSVKSINAILMSLFGDSGNAYCTDGHDMTMTYTFTFILSPLQAAIVGQSGVLPKPVGVFPSIVQT
jgi:hypothetical protein